MNKRKLVNIILTAVNILLIGIAAALFGVICSLREKYTTDSAKIAWDGGKYTYAQVSLFLPPDKGIDAAGVYSLRKAAENKMKEASVLTGEYIPAGRGWIDCASGEMKLTVSGISGKCDASATGTYGDYFIFHPERLMHGSYYSSEDVNIDRIVIDKECSWQLFGALDTVGMPVSIGSKVFYVAAVVDSPEGKDDKAAYGISPRIYMPYEAMKELDGDFKMTVYEVCMPNAIKDYAYNVMKDINPAGDSGEVVDQSGRFGLIKLIKGVKEIPESVMIKSGTYYPWFENIARGAEIKARIASMFLPYLLAIPAVSLVYLIFSLVKLIGAGFRKLWELHEKRYQKKISEIYYKTHSKTQ